MKLSQDDIDILEWLFQKTSEWEGSFLIDDPSLKEFKTKLEKALVLIESLKLTNRTEHRL